MQNLRERIAYLKGLSSGLNVQQTSPEGRLLREMMEVIEELAKELQVLNSAHSLLEDYVETLDDDLSDLEVEVYESDFDDDLYEYDEDADYYEMECPNCHETVVIYDDMMDEEEVAEIVCPECQHTLLVADEFSELRESFVEVDDTVTVE
ncbi:hypothetical protein LSG31_20020 [Fodinisporobacter ferrooxydans]|uniref:AraC family transcriptional regulator n=1 Tax=Fodinisporobacter ferrooxydans TaxID=2901836 RepID=A0ABY4CLR9_9BACL|nr:hypothetical protein LSG31_20020 [Alicyclobacillaceae bacterium MYW30-H2]